MRSLYFARYYFLVVFFIIISLIITTIAKAIQTKEENNTHILSSVISSYKKLQSPSKASPIILESVSETEELPHLLSKAQASDTPEKTQITSKSATSFILSASFKAIETQTALSQTTEKPHNPEEITEALHNDISAIIAQKSEPSSTLELLIPDTVLNNYLLFTLFPHRKSEIIKEPIAHPYKEHGPVDDISVIKLANKIDASLSFSEDSMLDEYENAEAFFDENHAYYEGFDDYDDEFLTLLEQQKAIDKEDSQTYPYLQSPLEILEAESIFENFEEQPIANQIEQLLTTGDYFLLANNPIKARQYYVRAVKTGAIDKSSPFYAKALVKLADMEDNAYLARFQYTNALDIYEANEGFDMEVADILVKLVWTFDMASERIVIYELLTKAKQIHEDHSYTPQYTEVLRNLAIYYETVNDYERADANYKAALALDLQYLTTSDIRTILALENYAAFYLKFNEFEKAEEILLFKLEAHNELSPPDYYNLGRTQSMLGWTYLQMNELDNSLHQYNSALGNINYSITKNRFMPHYYSLPAIFDLIYFFIYTKEPALAVPYFDVAVALLESENEEETIQYLQETSFEEIDPERIVNYPWAAQAQIKGLISIIEYIQSTKN
ncbi:tetratricopeptide repeat protein [Ignatzschineria rhizosphaerae]|uniref:Tetratricopeptide repeat protein n=1 Tax=Ignatzschineria rhizosphaerae TaxID=2923279 RepID=A0ABY3X5B3_9GAMM|nr:tetratricopeptide repeat protein [Ignatzschineria rhizosphaerae]UNM95193.1 tetratricopeptide repeat protein [Ignatzschineria rhizosphaerae]